jgi:anthranilate phosphoribosyltransferase
VNGEQISEYVLDPRDVGVTPDSDPSRADGWAGGTPQENAQVTRAILRGEATAGGRPAGEALAVINAGAAIYAAGRADSIAEGVDAARAALADGRAAAALELYVQASRRYAPTEAVR